ncbi:hypothetical protein PHYSODRAFT_299735 [Phytophthora sojae]|uniref:RxLR effector protein n=1 Tax=Phytophthora sojae (strain P6497) TaxID=1094619 RepID=G4Z773_PHYSP|nr:hypothetical protein PHYSODRAFT_299735 [Phytophthora sojae]EGZ22457.1 hypothetical protein PHYSODRAFT_299735 [Phytophthora sojae]|eukprot:XP_009525174.1 hypothetical protein PHYSODRAFT_299735 [Phytophthora sojae]
MHSIFFSPQQPTKHPAFTEYAYVQPPVDCSPSARILPHEAEDYASDDKGLSRGLKTTKTDNQQDEERLNFSFVKKLPVVSQLRAAAAARKTAAQAKQAELSALFKITDPRDHITFQKFQMWRKYKYSPQQAGEMMATFKVDP